MDTRAERMLQFARASRFVEAARHGMLPAASQGEQIAARLLDALRPFRDDLPFLDPNLRTAFGALVERLGGPFANDAEKAVAEAFLKPPERRPTSAPRNRFIDEGDKSPTNPASDAKKGGQFAIVLRPTMDCENTRCTLCGQEARQLGGLYYTVAATISILCRECAFKSDPDLVNAYVAAMLAYFNQGFEMGDAIRNPAP